MDGQEKNIKKSVTPAQGAGSADELSGSVNAADVKGANTANEDLFAKDAKNAPEANILVVSEIPEWVKDVLASNERVIESNKSVVDSIESFKQNAGPIILDALSEMNSNNEGVKTPKKEVIEPIIGAVYKVSEGKMFHDKESGYMINAGTDVSHFDNDRLSKLLSMGIIEAVTED